MVLALPEALFVNAKMGDCSGISSLNTSLYRSCHSRVRGAPRDPQQLRCRLHSSAGLNYLDCQLFKKQRDPKMLGCPWWDDGLHAVLRAAAPRQASHEFRHELHGVEMPLAAFISMVGDSARLSAFNAPNSASNRLEPNLNAVFFDRPGNVRYLPGIIEFKQAGIGILGS